MTSKIDHTGTAPGLAQNAPERKTVNMKCKNPNCTCIEAEEVNIQVGTGFTRVYKCTKCHRSWGATVGGAVNL